MKKNTVLRLALGAGFVLSGTYAFTNSGGGQTGLSGSPLSNNATCNQCHSGGSNQGQAVAITTDIPPAGFVPNTNYTVTIAASGNPANSFGYMASVEGAGQHQGTKTALNNESSVNSSNWVNHTGLGNTGSGGSKQWSFTWNSGTAPDQTTIYAAVNFANGNGNTLGDLILTGNLVLSKAPGVGVDENGIASLGVYPNPAGNVTTWKFNRPTSIQEVQVYNLSGSVVKVLDAGLFSGPMDEIPVDLSGLAPGQYILRVQQQDGLLEAKVLKF